MVEIRIPGLDHSLSVEGEWVRDDTYHIRQYDYRDPKGLPAKLKIERRSEQNREQLRIGDAMAAR